MKVFVVFEYFTDGGAEGDFIHEIFSTREKAEAFIKEPDDDLHFLKYDWQIKEWEVK